MRPVKAIARLFSKADRSAGDGACWSWLGPRDKDGYGTVRLVVAFGEKRAHRAMWVAMRGPIPDGQCVLHRCDNPPCVNPAHLFLGTQADNQHDRHAKGRYATGDQHHWHRRPLRGENAAMAKLTAAQVAEIRARFVDRYGAQTALAREYGVTQSTIHLIVRNKSWRETA